MLRGIRGAIQAERNTAEDILHAATILMERLIEVNSVQIKNVAAVFFTVTPDLNATFPAEVRKHLGWTSVPFLCSQEIPVPDSMRNILRVLVLFETSLEQDQIRHQYLGAASALRPDLQSDSAREGGFKK
ncbi:chorismate mutase [bacterium]|nr:chorismate mutase [bacterium]